MSTPTYVGAASTIKSDTTATSLDASLPAVAAGDVTFLAVTRYGSETSAATPAGWTLLGSTNFRAEPGGGYTQMHVFYKVAAAASAASSVTISGTGLSYWTAQSVVYRGADPSGPIASSALADGKTTGYATAPAISSASNAARIALTGYRTDQYWPSTPPTGWLRRGSEFSTTAWEASAFTAAAQQFAYGNVSNDLNWHAASIAVAGVNVAPNAPTLTSPPASATIDRSSAQRFAWTFSDPDAGDSQSGYDLRYRTIGAPTWTTVTGATPNAFHDFAAGTFAAGDYEWQVRAYDAQAEVGPYAGSGFFTAADPTDVPTITSPINGSTVGADPTTITWSTAGGQDAYQVRKVADNAGAPDTATVYYDSGEVVSTTARAASVPFPTNNRYEHIQVRIKLDGLWSAWASVRVLVSYTPPETPVVEVAVDNDTGSLLVTITNPAPGAGVPTTSYNDVYIDDGDGLERKAALVAPNSAWRYWTPVSGRDYAGSVSVTAVGDNGTTSSST